MAFLKRPCLLHLTFMISFNLFRLNILLSYWKFRNRIGILVYSCKLEEMKYYKELMKDYSCQQCNYTIITRVLIKV